MSSPEASFHQLIFRPNGVLVRGGLLQGHKVVERLTWTVVDETSAELVVRINRPNGEKGEITIAFQDDDTFVIDNNVIPIWYRRVDEVAPLSWLRKEVAK